MSILIRGIEMPKDCESCPCNTADAFGGLGCRATGYIPLRKANQNRPDNCPLVPVPAHGRMIDADLLCKVLQKNSEDEWNSKTAPFSWAYAYDCVKDTVENMPTILEAEEGADGN